MKVENQPASLTRSAAVSEVPPTVSDQIVVGSQLCSTVGTEFHQQGCRARNLPFSPLQNKYAFIIKETYWQDRLPGRGGWQSFVRAAARLLCARPPLPSLARPQPSLKQQSAARPTGAHRPACRGRLRRRPTQQTILDPNN